MDYQDYHYDPDNYRTGRTRPPKRRSGLIAFLLVVIIFLGGLSSALGVMNIRLFRQISAQTPVDTAPISFSASEDPSIPPETTDSTVAPEVQDMTIELQNNPGQVGNIPQEGGLSLQQIYTKTIDSVVSIVCRYPGGSSSGTGVVLTRDGFVVTNCHVVENAQSIQVHLTDERELAATVVGLDAISDLAVLQVDAQDLVPAEFGDSSALQVGDLAVAIGDPLGVELRGTMTDGIISAINRDITTDGRTLTLLQTNAALNSGNSGGPLLNCYGQVIGINTLKIGDYTSAAGVEGLGFAIPSTTVKEVVDQLVTQGYVSGRPELGITGEEISPLYQHLYYLPEGLFITEVAENSDAAAKGISPGDVLISIDDTRITDMEELKTCLYSHTAGDTVQVVIYRSGKSYQLTLTIGEAN